MLIECRCWCENGKALISNDGTDCHKILSYLPAKVCNQTGLRGYLSSGHFLNAIIICNTK